MSRTVQTDLDTDSHDAKDFDSILSPYPELGNLDGNPADASSDSKREKRQLVGSIAQDVGNLTLSTSNNISGAADKVVSTTANAAQNEVEDAENITNKFAEGIPTSISDPGLPGASQDVSSGLPDAIQDVDSGLSDAIQDVGYDLPDGSGLPDGSDLPNAIQDVGSGQTNNIAGANPGGTPGAGMSVATRDVANDVYFDYILKRTPELGNSNEYLDALPQSNLQKRQRYRRTHLIHVGLDEIQGGAN